MKISSMTIEGYGNIKLASLELDPKMNLVSGKNGAGKSSLINAMIDGIKGKKEIGKDQISKIRTGSQKAKISISIDNGDLIIERTITNKGVYLKAHRSDGTDVMQKDLDQLLGASTVNINKMLGMKPKEQIDFIKEVARIDIEDIEKQYKFLYEERTIQNRIEKELKAKLSEDIPEEAEEVSISDLLKEQQIILDKNKIVSDQESAHAYWEKRKSDAEAQIARNNKDMAALKRKMKKDEAELKRIEKEKHPIGEKVDTKEIDQKLQESTQTNIKARKWIEYSKKKAELEEIQNKLIATNNKMTQLLKERSDKINSGRLPFSNIELDKDRGIVIDGIPLNNKSTAEQIRMMARMYIESNPSLKVIYIQDGSLLDEDTLREISEMSDLLEYQFLVEIVEEREGSIVMREGAIASDEEDIEEKEEL